MRRRVRRSLGPALAALVAVGTLTACASGHHGRGARGPAATADTATTRSGAGETGPSGEKSPSSETTRSDRVARLIALSDSIAERVATVRGLSVRAPLRKGIVSREDVRKMVAENVTKERTANEIAAEAALMVRLALFDEGTGYLDLMLDLMAEQVAGFYDAERKKLFLADWIDPDPMALAHEIAHALQDQHFDLMRYKERAMASSDFALAYSALIEGDAVGASLDFTLAPRGTFLDVPGVVEAMRGIDTGVGSAPGHDLEPKPSRTPLFDTAPAFVRKLLLFPYVEGFAMVYDVRKAGGWAAVDALFGTPPPSTEAVLHSHRLGSSEEPETVPVPAAPTLAKTHAIAFDDVVGEYQLYALLAHHLDEETARTAAAGWAGDRIVLRFPRSRTPSDPPTAEDVAALVAIHVVAFDTAADAAEAQRALTAFGERVTALRGGRFHLRRRAARVVWAVGLDDATASKILDPLVGVGG